MNRASGIAACLLAAAILLPASAEAKRRFGGSSSAVTSGKPATKPVRRGVVVVPIVGSQGAKATEKTAPQRVPFPPASAQSQADAPVLLRLTSSDAKPVWCRSEVVVGGFCLLN